MQMPIIVGIVVAIIFLVAFSEWFYHMVTGWKEVVLDDVYFRYRIAGVSILSILIMSGTFYGLALVNECPNENREGVFAKLNCDDFSKIKVETDKLFSAGN
jgi:hypothetical protein